MSKPPKGMRRQAAVEGGVPPQLPARPQLHGVVSSCSPTPMSMKKVKRSHLGTCGNRGRKGSFQCGSSHTSGLGRNGACFGSEEGKGCRRPASLGGGGTQRGSPWEEALGAGPFPRASLSPEASALPTKGDLVPDPVLLPLPSTPEQARAASPALPRKCLILVEAQGGGLGTPCPPPPAP